MTIEEIKANLYAEDKMMCAVKYETHISYINQILSGYRRSRSRKAQEIIGDLRQRAIINMDFKQKKQSI